MSENYDGFERSIIRPNVITKKHILINKYIYSCIYLQMLVNYNNILLNVQNKGNNLLYIKMNIIYIYFYF